MTERALPASALGLERILFVTAAVAAGAAWIGPGIGRGEDPVAWASLAAAGLAALLAGLRPRSRRSVLATFPLVWAMAAAAGLGPVDALGLASALITSAAALALSAQWVTAGRASAPDLTWTPIEGARPETTGGLTGTLAAVLVLAAGAVPATGLLDTEFPSVSRGPLAAGLSALGLGVGLWLADGVSTPAPPRRPALVRRITWMLFAGACLAAWWWLRGPQAAAVLP